MLLLPQGLKAQDLTISSSGETGTSGTNWSITGTTLTATGTANIQASVIETALSSGNLTVVAGDIQVSQNITSNTANVLTLKASGYISLEPTQSITRSGGDVILWSNSANETSGVYNNEIWLRADNTINTNGGKIVLAGGPDDGSNGGVAGDGIPDGFAYRGYNDYGAVGFVAGGGNPNTGNITLNSGGGDILIRGQGYLTGVESRADNLVINSGAGTVRIEGIAQDPSTGTVNSQGIAFRVGNSTITSANTTANAITLIGTSTSPSDYADGILLWGTGTQEFSATGSGGGVTITSTAGANKLHTFLINDPVYILANGGPINITATGGISTAKLEIGTETGSKLVLGATDAANTTNDVTSSTSNITVDVADRGYFWYANVNPAVDDPMQINTTGTVTFSHSAFDFNNSWVTFGATPSGLTIGIATGNTGNVTFDDAQTVNGPISVYGGDIAINENIITTGGGAAGDVLMKGSGNVIQAASKLLTTSSGDVTLWADSDGSGAGYIQLTGGSNSGIVSGGGHVFLGGGTDLATGYAKGAAVQDAGTFNTYISGVHLRNGTTINSGGGNITLRGQNVGDNQNIMQFGILGHNTTLDAGTGKIALYGKASGSGTANAQAISSMPVNLANEQDWIIRSSNTDADAITLIGDATSTDNSFTSLGINFWGTIEATGTGGGITMTGTSGTSTNYGDGLDIFGDVLAASGTITLVGIDDASNANNRDVLISGATLGSKTATNVSSSTTNVVVRGNRPAFASSAAVNSSGTFTLEPRGNDFTNAITYPITDLALDASVSGLTIGKASSADGTSDVDVTIAGATTISGPVTVYGGTITLDADLTTTNSGDISLYTDNALGGLSATRNLTAAGSFKYIPGGSSFAGAVTYPITNLNSSVNGLVIGKSTNTANITIAAAVSVTGPFELYGGALALNENVSCSNMVLDGDTSTLAAGKYINATGNFTHEGPVTLAATSGSNYAQLKFGGTYSGSNGAVIQQQHLNAGWVMVGASMNATTSSFFGNVGSNGPGHTNNTQNLYSWDGTNYVNVSSATAITPGMGYFGFVGQYGFQSAAGVHNFSGAPNTSVTPSLVNATANQSVAIEGTHINERDGWNLMANPFTCALDFNRLSLSNVNNAFYIYNNNKSGGAGYEFWSAGGITDPYIAPMQSFWVKADSNGTPDLGTLSMGTHGTVSSSPSHLRVQMFDRLVLRAYPVADTTISDYTVVSFIEHNTTRGYDGAWDAIKMENGGVNIYSKHNNGDVMAINAIPYGPGFSHTENVPISFKAPHHGGHYTIRYDDRFMVYTYTVYLEDKLAKTFTDLSAHDYTFINDTGITDRFVLHFSAGRLNINAMASQQSHSRIDAWVFEQHAYLQPQMDVDVEVALYNIGGHKLQSARMNLTKGRRTEWPLRQDLAAGVYLLRIASEAGIQTIKFTR